MSEFTPRPNDLNAPIVRTDAVSHVPLDYIWMDDRERYLSSFNREQGSKMLTKFREQFEKQYPDADQGITNRAIGCMESVTSSQEHLRDRFEIDLNSKYYIGRNLYSDAQVGIRVESDVLVDNYVQNLNAQMNRVVAYSGEALRPFIMKMMGMYEGIKEKSTIYVALGRFREAAIASLASYLPNKEGIGTKIGLIQDYLDPQATREFMKKYAGKGYESVDPADNQYVERVVAATAVYDHIFSGKPIRETEAR